MKILTLSFAASFFALTLQTGCASYHLGHYRRTLPGGYDTVAIPMFQNKTVEVGIETFFTKALRTEFERSGLAKVMSKNDAQVVLEGTITKLAFVGSNGTQYGDTNLQTKNPLPDPTSTPPGLVTNLNPLPRGTTLNKTYSSTVFVTIVARKTADNSILWQGDFTSQRNYSAPLIGTPSLTSSNALYNQNSRDNTLERQAEDLMSEAHDRLTENF